MRSTYPVPTRKFHSKMSPVLYRLTILACDSQWYLQPNIAANVAHLSNLCKPAGILKSGSYGVRRNSTAHLRRACESGIQISSTGTVGVENSGNIFLLNASINQAVSLRVLSCTISSVTRTSWLFSSSDNTIQVGKTHSTVMPKLRPMLTK